MRPELHLQMKFVQTLSWGCHSAANFDKEQTFANHKYFSIVCEIFLCFDESNALIVLAQRSRRPMLSIVFLTP